jgi:Carboxypeptidase regulatory-like domain/TonB dependent receptor-like, beta-barrel
MSWRQHLVICLLWVACAAPALHAQFETAVVLGTIRDGSGAVVPGATITLRNTETGITATTVTDENGTYQFLNVRIGTYQLTAECQGFSTAIAKDIGVAVNARQRVDLSLQVGALSDEVLVTGGKQLLETDSSERGQVIERQQIVNLPLNGRSYASLALLSTGVLESNQNGIGTSGREGSFNVNGLRNTANNFQLDGVDNNAYGTSNQGFSNQVIQVSPDAVAEFKVQTNNYSAEYGRSGGAVVNASYRSGTNDFHGSAWEFHRNTVLNATGFFKPTGGQKPSLIRNQFGYVFGGPIVRDRTFFFTDYEGFRQVQKTLVFSTIPTLAQRDGVLTVPVVNPFTGQTYAAGTPIPMTDFARKVLNELPAPSVPGVTSNNYQKGVPNRSNYNKFNLRLDHKVSDRLSGFVRIGQQKNDAFEAPNIDGPSGSNQNGFIDVLARQFVGGATYVIGPTSVLDMRLGISRMEAGKKPPVIGGPSMRELYGIVGLPENDPSLTGGLTPQTITGYSQLGRQSTNPQFQNPFDVNPRVTLTNVLGRHSVKVGFEFAAINTEVQDTNPLYGLDTYSSQFSRPAGAAANNLYSLADFYFGARTQYELASLIVAEMRQRAYYTFVQDDFKVNNRLTLNLGLRYELVTPYYEAENRLANFDLATNTIVMAKDGSLADRALVEPDRNNFAPRFGFAFQPLNDTVIRGGYGIGYVHFNRLASAGLLATNYPIVTRATVTQSLTKVVDGKSEPVGLCTGDQFTGCFRTTQQGYPPNLPNNVVLYIPREWPSGYLQSWHLSVQQKITSNIVVDAAYVGNHGVKLAMLADINQARPPVAGEDANATLAARRPIQGFGTISSVLPQAFSNYHAFQGKVEYRRGASVNILNSFTWSKAIDNVSQVLEEPNGSTGTPQNVYDIANDRGLSAYDVPLLNVTSFVWNVPVGEGQRFGKRLPAILNGILGGWQLSGIHTMRSGRTVNLRYNTSGPTPVTSGLPTFLGGVALRPNLTGDPLAPESERSIDNYFNRNNITLPTATQPFGTAGRNVARGYPFYQLDLGVQKRFGLPVGHGTALEIRAEGFNVLNKTNFGAPNGDRSSGAFGTIRSTFVARQLQFAAKLLF